MEPKTEAYLEFNDKVTLRFSDESIYTGPVLDRKPHGNGCLTYKNGRQFIGEFFQGHPHEGYGYVKYDDLSAYKGYMYNGDRNGYGTLTYPDSWSFTGYWKYNLPFSGNGFFIYPNGDHFEGEISQGFVVNGKVNFKLFNNLKYTGKLVNGQISGDGAFHYLKIEK